MHDHLRDPDELPVDPPDVPTDGDGFPMPDDALPAFAGEDEVAAIEDDLAAAGAYDTPVLPWDLDDFTPFANFDPAKFVTLDPGHPDLIEIDAEIVGDEVEVFDAFAGAPLSSVAALRRGLMALDDDRQALAKVGDVDTLAFGVADLTVLISDLQTLQRSARDDIAKVLLWNRAVENEALEADGKKPKKGNPKHEVPGLGIIDVPGGNEWKDWDSPALLRRLMSEAILENGELRHFDHPNEVVDAVYDVLVACLPVTASLGWRVGQFDKVTEEWTGLRGAGIDPEDYASHTAKARLAVVPKRAES